MQITWHCTLKVSCSSAIKLWSGLEIKGTACSIIMNALDCRTLTAIHACTTPARVLHSSLCMLVQYQEYWTTYTLYLNRVLVLFSSGRVSAWSKSRGRAPGYVTISLCYIPKLIMHLRTTSCLHCHCIDNWPVKHRVAIIHVAEVHRCHVNADWQQLHTTTPLGRTTCPLFFYAECTSNAYLCFLSDDQGSAFLKPCTPYLLHIP